MGNSTTIHQQTPSNRVSQRCRFHPHTGQQANYLQFPASIRQTLQSVQNQLSTTAHPVRILQAIHIAHLLSHLYGPVLYDNSPDDPAFDLDVSVCRKESFCYPLAEKALPDELFAAELFPIAHAVVGFLVQVVQYAHSDV